LALSAQLPTQRIFPQNYPLIVSISHQSTTPTSGDTGGLINEQPAAAFSSRAARAGSLPPCSSGVQMTLFGELVSAQPGVCAKHKRSYEKANKVLSGVASGAASRRQPQRGGHLGKRRDGRKYGVFLPRMAQTVSALPKNSFSSCEKLYG